MRFLIINGHLPKTEFCALRHQNDFALCNPALQCLMSFGDTFQRVPSADGHFKTAVYGQVKEFGKPRL